MWDWLVSFVFFLSQSNARISRIQVRVCTVRRLVAFGYDVPFGDRSDSGMCRSKFGCIRWWLSVMHRSRIGGSRTLRVRGHPSLRYCVRREIETNSKSFLPHNGPRWSFF